MTAPLRPRLYPPIEPYRVERLRVSPVHELYVEESGRPDGVPILFLHGGPGGGTEPRHRQFFDPKYFRIVLFDQRGAGRSRPFASLEDNTTWHLVADIEQLRIALGIERWHVFGGSWGSTLALVYAQMHPERVRSLVLRGIFTFRDDEVDWFCGGGAKDLFPDAYERFLAALSPFERDDPVAAYYRRLTSPDERTRLEASEAWSQWECRLATLLPDDTLLEHCRDPSFTLAFSRIECHYFRHRGFFGPETEIYARLDRLQTIPTILVHGRYDIVCPMQNAWRLARALPQASLRIIEGAGHAATEPGIAAALVQATDELRR